MPRPTAAERRAELLAASGTLVRQRGFTTTRLADVAAAVGLSAPLVVYHFGTKDALMAATLAAEAEAELGRLDLIVRGDRSPPVKLQRILAMSLGPDAVADWALWIDAWGEGLRSPVMRQHLEALDRRWRRAFEAVIVDGVAEGTFVSADPAASAARLMALVDGYGVQLVRARSPRSRRRVLAAARAAVGAELGVHLGRS